MALLESAYAESCLPLAATTSSGSAVASPAAHAGSIDRRDKLAYREFVHEYMLPRRPVVLTQATRDWPARQWTPQVLREKAGHRVIRFREGQREYTLAELVDLIEASTPERPAPYVRNVELRKQLPELAADVLPRLKYAVPDWLSCRLLPRDWLFSNELEELFFGGAGASFPALHVDYFGMDGFLAQLYGSKEFLLFAPSDGQYLYTLPDDPLTSSIANFDAPDYERYPLLRQATPIRFTLRAGETLYQPNGWWHTTRMHEISMTLIYSTWNRANWSELIRQYRYYAYRDRRGLNVKAEAVTVGLKAVGLWQRARDAAARPFRGD